jgi:hypothetical protein
MRESLILMLARAEKLDEANKELRNWQQQLGQQPSAPMYKALLNAYEQAEMWVILNKHRSCFGIYRLCLEVSKIQLSILH